MIKTFPHLARLNRILNRILTAKRIKVNDTAIQNRIIQDFNGISCCEGCYILHWMVIIVHCLIGRMIGHWPKRLTNYFIQLVQLDYLTFTFTFTLAFMDILFVSEFKVYVQIIVQIQDLTSIIISSIVLT